MKTEQFFGGIGCFGVLEHLSDYVDGEAPADLVIQIEAHLEQCDACEKFGGEFAAVVRAVRERLGAEPALDSDVSRRLRARLGID